MEPVKIEKTAATPSPMKVFVLGRVERKRRHEGVSYTQVVTPSADAYSRPQLLEVRSKSIIGDVGEEVKIWCQLGGYSRKAYQYTDKSTGEVIKVHPVDMTLDLIES